MGRIKTRVGVSPAAAVSVRQAAGVVAASKQAHEPLAGQVAAHFWVAGKKRDQRPSVKKRSFSAAVLIMSRARFAWICRAVHALMCTAHTS